MEALTTYHSRRQAWSVLKTIESLEISTALCIEDTVVRCVAWSQRRENPAQEFWMHSPTLLVYFMVDDNKSACLCFRCRACTVFFLNSYYYNSYSCYQITSTTASIACQPLYTWGHVPSAIEQYPHTFLHLVMKNAWKHVSLPSLRVPGRLQSSTCSSQKEERGYLQRVHLMMFFSFLCKGPPPVWIIIARRPLLAKYAGRSTTPPHVQRNLELASTFGRAWCAVTELVAEPAHPAI